MGVAVNVIWVPSGAGDFTDGVNDTDMAEAEAAAIARRKKKFLMVLRLSGGILRDSNSPMCGKAPIGAGCTLERRAPAQAWKTREVVIERDPFAARFDGEGGKPGVGCQVTARVNLEAQIGEDLPMSRTGKNQTAIGLGH